MSSMKYVYKKKTYRILFSVFDAIGAVIFFPLKLMKRRTKEKTDRILVIRTDHVGDVIFATSVLPPLRRAFPSAEIDFMVPSWAMGILKRDPHVNNIIQFDPPWFDRNKKGLIEGLKVFFNMAGTLKKGRYDVVIDLRGDARHIAASFTAGIRKRISYGITGLGFLLTDNVPYGDIIHETQRNTALLSALGIESRVSDVTLYFSDKDIIRSGEIKKEAGLDKPYAIVHVVPGHPSKNWTLEGFVKTVRYLRQEKGFIPVLIGTQEDGLRIKDVITGAGVDVVDLAGRTKLSELGPLCAGASLFVGLDSGPSHIAAYTGIPTIILFSGVNDPVQWAPKGENVRIIYPGKEKDLSGITPGEVMGEIDRVMG
jgi:ADP-heptose:LPS heptosyltransferase